MQKRNLIILVVIVALGVIALISMLSNHAVDQTASKADKANFSSPLNNIDAESIVLEKTQKELHENKKQTDSLQEKITTLTNNKNSENEILKQSNVELSKRIALLEKQFSSTNATLPVGQSSSIPGSDEYQGSLLPSSQGLNAKKNSNYSIGRGIREDNLSLADKGVDAGNMKPTKNPETYVPAGTFVKAVMIGGADASAGVNAQANPVPMLFRLIAKGTLPNHKQSHLKDCVVTAAAVGDVSSERGQIRTESLSCVFPNGEVVDQQIEGTVFGPDGKNAVRGNYYMGGSRFIGNAFAAGTLSGLSEGLSQTYTANSISAEGNVQTVNPGGIFQYGAAKGAGKAMNKLADYNIQRAEQYHPVIQLSAGTVVDVVFLKGFYLDGKKHEIRDNIANSSVTKSANSPTLFPDDNTDSQTLPLSEDQVKRIQARSKELGLRVNTLQES
jgi:conjugal transfer pilus assembly protein TraB